MARMQCKPFPESYFIKYLGTNFIFLFVHPCSQNYIKVMSWNRKFLKFPFLLSKHFWIGLQCFWNMQVWKSPPISKVPVWTSWKKRDQHMICMKSSWWKQICLLKIHLKCSCVCLQCSNIFNKMFQCIAEMFHHVSEMFSDVFSEMHTCKKTL